MRIILFVWKDGVVERFGRLANSFRRLGHEAVLALHPRSNGSVSYGGTLVRSVPLPELFDRTKPDCIVLWNGNLPKDTTVKAECRRRAVPVLYCEMGWFPQADTVYFDWEGVNGASSIRHHNLAPLDPTRYHDLMAFISRYHKAMAGGLVPSQLLRDFLLVPLQLETDSNVLLYSLIRSMAKFVRRVRHTFPGEEILVRPHPKSTTGNFTLPQGCSYADPALGLHSLLPRAKAVVALNSTTLLEALTYFKPAVAFGEGVFSGHGVVPEASKVPLRTLREFVSQPIDATRHARIAALLYELAFRRTFYNAELGNPDKVAAAPFYAEMLRLPGSPAQGHRGGTTRLLR